MYGRKLRVSKGRRKGLFTIDMTSPYLPNMRESENTVHSLKEYIWLELPFMSILKFLSQIWTFPFTFYLQIHDHIINMDSINDNQKSVIMEKIAVCIVEDSCFLGHEAIYV